MKTFILYPCILLAALLSLLGSCQDAFITPVLHLVIPNGYRGLFLLIVEEKDGVPFVFRKGRCTLHIPPDGILKIRTNAPLYQAHDYYVSFANGRKIPIAAKDENTDPRQVAFHMLGGDEWTQEYFIGTPADLDTAGWLPPIGGVGGPTGKPPPPRKRPTGRAEAVGLEIDPHWAVIAAVLGMGLLLGSLAVRLQPRGQMHALPRLLFGTVWGALGAIGIGGLMAGGFAVELACFGAEAGLLGGALYNRLRPKYPVLFGGLYGLVGGALVVFGFLMSLPDNLSHLAQNGFSLFPLLWGSVYLGAPLGWLWGTVGGVVWSWLDTGR